jgi:hypothetical protein
MPNIIGVRESETMSVNRTLKIAPVAPKQRGPDYWAARFMSL